MQHSPIGGSVQHRVLNCHGSVHLSRCATRTSGAAADRGNVMHEHAKARLTNGPMPGTNLRPSEVPIVESYVAGVPAGAHIEERVSSCAHDWLFGTVDAYWIDADGRLNIADLKTGRTPVSPEENVQLFFYMYLILGFQRTLEEMRPFFWICQPTCGGWSKWEVTARAYCDYLDKLNALMDSLTLEDGITLNTGSWCQYCPAKKDFCPKYRQHTAVVDDAF